MKTLSISSDGISCDADFHARLFATSCFPNSPADVEQWLAVYNLERVRWLQDNENFEGSFLEKAVSHALAKRIGRNASAGLVLHSYLYLCEKGVPPSLEKASKLASEVAYSINGIWVPISGQKEFKKVNADQAGMKKAFREFRGVAHIIAARMLLPESTFFSSTLMWKQEHILNFAKLTFEMQQKVEKISDSGRWDLWRLIDHPEEFEKANSLSSKLEANTLKAELNQAYKTVFGS